MRRFVLELTADHVRNPRSLGREYYRIVQAIGRILACDVGKRVYEVSPGIYQVENDEQRDSRQAP